MVNWNLTFVHKHTSIIRQLLEHPQADSGYDWFFAISFIVKQAFNSIRSILGGLDMHASDRKPAKEFGNYRLILGNVEAISATPNGDSLVTLTLVRVLMDAFSQLIGEHDWRNTISGYDNVKDSKDILIRLEAKLLSTPTAPVAQLDEARMSVGGVSDDFLYMLLWILRCNVRGTRHQTLAKT